MNIDQDRVTVKPKPGFPQGVDLEQSTDFTVRRVRMYRDFIQQVLRETATSIEIDLVVDVSDEGFSSNLVPVFTFQKPFGSPSVLLPDIDFLNSNFYIEEFWQDHVTFENKSDTAAFAGSTTGGQITMDVARGLQMPRLRSAAFFRGSEVVNFKLTEIVQCASSDVQLFLQSLGFGGGRIDWTAQYNSKFLISMDGNGAACSRLVTALRSNSIVLKYSSPHRLYYFEGLTPWLHYVPIEADEDVVRVVELEKRDPGALRHVAVAGKLFYESFLTKEAVYSYTASLLKMYERVFRLE